MFKKTFVLTIPIEFEMKDLSPDDAASYSEEALSSPDAEIDVSVHENKKWLQNLWLANCQLQKAFQASPEDFSDLKRRSFRPHEFPEDLDVGLPDLRDVIARAAKRSCNIWRFFPEGRALSVPIEDTAEPLLEFIKIEFGPAKLCESSS